MQFTIRPFLLIIAVFYLTSFKSFACESRIIIKLENINGGFFGNQKVTLTSKSDGATFTQKSNERGEAEFIVPCSDLFEISISNHAKRPEIQSPKANGVIVQRFTYSADMIKKQQQLALSEAEQEILNDFFKTTPDTLVLTSSVMAVPKVSANYYALEIISIRDLKNAPLQGETLAITGRNRGKTIRGTTDKNGRLIVYLPKGDLYDINFKYHSQYTSVEVVMTRGTSDMKLNFSYLGSREFERRKKIEEERIAREEERLKREEELFKKRCEALGLTLEECRARETESYLAGETELSDTVVNVVMARNVWASKLIVCDVTGSMGPYIAQVAKWYRLDLKKSKTVQIVFFNDGDGKADSEKIVGETGGVHYIRTGNVDSLDSFMAKVQALGGGGDAPENNIEALLQGISIARPYTDLVMIADNYAPVKDITLIKRLKQPVHIIVCGANEGWIHPDYLKIARATKGSVHTIEEDLTTLSSLLEGEELSINGFRYKIMGGDFIRLDL